MNKASITMSLFAILVEWNAIQVDDATSMRPLMAQFSL